MKQFVIQNIRELVTLAPLHQSDKRAGINEQDLGLLKGAWLAIADGKIFEYGEGDIPSKFERWHSIDAENSLVTPGLVDCHTHPIFGGDRSHEFAQRLNGASYQDIAAAGGGIKSTIKHTRDSSDQDLVSNCITHLNSFLEHGVTTVECKTGYGQNPSEELRMLKLLNEVKGQVDQTLSITYLGLHAQPSEYHSKANYLTDMTEILETVAESELADWVDAFVEKGYFEVRECQAYFNKAKKLGLGVRIHADEFADTGAAAASAHWGAASADHLEEANSSGIKAMSQSGVIAVLLPGTSIYSKIKYADAEPFKQAGCQVALATDFNPGSCLLNNLSQVATLGALYCGLSTSEAIAAITLIPARALKLQEQKGHLSVGADADVIIHKHQSKEQWIADFGRHSPSQVFISGKLKKA